MVELKYGDFLTRGLKATLDILYIAACHHFYIPFEWVSNKFIYAMS